MREKLRDSYSETGRPSIDPELLLRILLIGYLYGITSERKLVEELRMHLAWRWFTGLGFDQEIPHHSTFSKNRHGRFQESKLFEQLFEEIVARCLEAGLVQGDNLSVDGSFVEANANKGSRIPREQLAEAAQVNRTVRQYLVELEEQNPVRRAGASAGAGVDHRSRCDLRDQGWNSRSARLLRQLPGGQSQLRDRGCASDGGAHEPGDGGRTRHDRSFRPMARTGSRSPWPPMPRTAMASFCNGCWNGTSLRTCATRDSAHRKNSPFYGPERFTYLPESNSYRCPQASNSTTVAQCSEPHPCLYRNPQALWGVPQKAQCTRAVSVSCHPHA